MTPLNITHRDASDGPVLHVAGELDHAQAALLRREVESLALRAGQCLDLDLSDLEFCDSTGITVLLAARQYAGAAEAGIVLTGVQPHLLRVLTMVGLDRVFTLRPAPDSPSAGTAAG
ncbi:STAS domain-containing protein [Streptomyces sp. ATE26]|uniref:STAS domain-containing protein n=1 Tax=unclassified Streptomyces TaxID=2593676 RepID=UPI0011756244|nr:MULTISPECIES: STAS domain-containing protein [unclassified Streptomyces]MDI1459207.1 STAS domain-containing protein [Streptomyces sp. ATE26]GEK01627.1 anti-sigma factor antagonist [Streptomyces sp. 1-11]